MKKTLILIISLIGINSCKSSENVEPVNVVTHYGKYNLTGAIVTDLRTNLAVYPVTGYTEIKEGKGIDILILNGSKVLLNQHLTFKEVVNSYDKNMIDFYNNNEWRGFVNKSNGILIYDFNRATTDQGYDCKFGLSFKKE